MKKTLILFAFLFSPSIFAGTATLCEQKIRSIIEDYRANDLIIKSYVVKNCSSTTDDMGPVFDENTNTNAPKITESNACAIILDIEGRTLQDLVVFDDINDFSLQRHFDNADNESYEPSRYGIPTTGTIMFIKSEGRGRDDLGFLKHIKFITRANYDLNNDVMRILKWKLGWFFNKYSHDYTVKCKTME
ncbi:MAG: hypothetical protein AABZ06_14850 [Bdellovibrionota bacterium]